MFLGKNTNVIRDRKYSCKKGHDIMGDKNPKKRPKPKKATEKKQTTQDKANEQGNVK